MIVLNPSVISDVEAAATRLEAELNAALVGKSPSNQIIIIQAGDGRQDKPAVEPPRIVRVNKPATPADSSLRSLWQLTCELYPLRGWLVTMPLTELNNAGVRMEFRKAFFPIHPALGYGDFWIAPTGSPLPDSADAARSWGRNALSQLRRIPPGASSIRRLRRNGATDEHLILRCRECFEISRAVGRRLQAELWTRDPVQAVTFAIRYVSMSLASYVLGAAATLQSSQSDNGVAQALQCARAWAHASFELHRKMEQREDGARESPRYWAMLAAATAGRALFYGAAMKGLVGTEGMKPQTEKFLTPEQSGAEAEFANNWAGFTRGRLAASALLSGFDFLTTWAEAGLAEPTIDGQYRASEVVTAREALIQAQIAFADAGLTSPGSS
jgi:hypothetical protein